MSGSKRTAIDMASIAKRAVAHPNPVTAALEDKPAAQLPRAAAVTQSQAAEAKQQASRRGKVGIQFWTDPGKRKRLKGKALADERSLDDICNEAIDQWLERNQD